MQKHNHIKALFFLGIFSILLVHQVVPHLHHQHDIEHSHEAVAQGDNHSHHHDVPEKENPKKGLFDLYLKIHVHSVVPNEILLTYESSVKLLKVKKDISNPVPNKHYNSSLSYEEAENISVYHPPDRYFNPYLSSLDSRGPPSLG